MGKPFKKELQSINEIYNWACSLEISELKSQIKLLQKNPLLIIGSGGSLSACYFAAKLFQSKGQIAKAVTPLELFYSKNIISKCALLFLSASGRNTDILTSFKTAMAENPVNVTGITLANNTQLRKISLKTAPNSIIEFDNPIGKDGFLATNSLIIFFTLLQRAFGYEVETGIALTDEDFQASLNIFKSKINKDYTFKLLYADWSLPVAIDIESKFSEAALGNILLADYRNFGHGRHNWLDKRSSTTAIIALITPEDKELAEKTLALIPSNIPVLKIETKKAGPFSSINLLIKSFYLADLMGDLQNIDPGRPGVPDYGSKLYNLNYQRLIDKNVDNFEKSAIQKKLGNIPFSSLSISDKEMWIEAANNYKDKINNQKFTSIVFDYDGTLCHAVDRYTGIRENIGKKINNLLENNIVIGIATGRGKSIRQDLQRVINKKYWDKIIIGYYNGSEIGLLGENTIPNKIFDLNEKLQLIGDKLIEKYTEKIGIKYKKNQLTIEFHKDTNTDFISEVMVFVNILNVNNVLCVQSDHSLDIILRPEVSKLNVLAYIKHKLTVSEGEILCFGDKGKYPGNDFELLSHPYSLSLDEVSTDFNSCWNFIKWTTGDTEKILYYLNKIHIYNGFFRLKL